MDFRFAHHIPHPPDAVAAALLDEGYQRSLHDIESLKARELIVQEQLGDGRVTRRVRCVLDIDLKGPARALAGSGDPAWVEEAEWNPDRREWVWHVDPEIGKDLLAADGTISLLKEGDGTSRAVHGHVRVKVPIYGSRVEGWIADGLEAAYAEEAERLTAWLEREKR